MFYNRLYKINNWLQQTVLIILKMSDKNSAHNCIPMHTAFDLFSSMLVIRIARSCAEDRSVGYNNKDYSPMCVIVGIGGSLVCSSRPRKKEAALTGTHVSRLFDYLLASRVVRRCPHCFWTWPTVFKFARFELGASPNLGVRRAGEITEETRFVRVGSRKNERVSRLKE